jgi:hypothetical protein
MAGLSSHRAHCVSSPDRAQSVVAASNDGTPALPMCRAPQVDSGGRYTPLTPRPPADTDVTPAAIAIPQTL